MNKDINTYTVKFKKMQKLIFIDIFDKYGSRIDFCYAPFNHYTNKYHLVKSLFDSSEPLTKIVIKVLLSNKLIEQADLEFCPKFTLTDYALISLL